MANDGWARYGLMQAQEAEGEVAAAKETRARLEQAWVGAATALDLARL